MKLQDLLYAIRDQQSNINDLDLDFFGFCCRNISDTKSQCFQDLWVLYETKNWSEGTFVEFGATDGITGSNTHLLEQNGWTGILAEPNPEWHDELVKNRPHATIDRRAVYSKTGEILPFVCTKQPDLATIQSYSGSDYHAETRKNFNQVVNIETVSLNDLLKDHMSSVKEIDYISIDTEGSELDILEAFDFNVHPVRLFSIEHNYGPNRDKIYNLMRSKGYNRVFENFSKWDDWYR